MKLPQPCIALKTISISPTQILVFGGKSDHWQKDSYIFNADTNSMTDSTEIPLETQWLIEQGTSRIDDTIYAQQRYDPFKLLSFDTNTKKWT